MWTMMLIQALSSFGQSLMATVNTIVGAQLSGLDWLAGMPGAALQIGAAAAAWFLGHTMDNWGRRLSLAAGMGLGAIGGLIAVIAVARGNFYFFLAGLLLTGFARAAALMGRFVAAEVTMPERRGRTISYVILGSTFGSVVGPLLTDPSTRLAESLQLPPFSGPFIFGLVVFLLGGLSLYFFLKPEPRDVGRAIAEEFPATLVHSGPTRSIGEILRTPAGFVALTAMLFGQVVMVGLMGITSLHMYGHDKPISAVAIVFSAHTLGMFAFSILTGQLLDRWGRGPVIFAGAALLLVSSAIAPIWLEVAPIAAALFLLGLGWNFCFIGGSTLLADNLTPDERAGSQSTNDLLIALATALTSFASGVIFDIGGYVSAGVVGALASIIPLVVVGWWMSQGSRPEPAV